jgi:hypothetical protein
MDRKTLTPEQVTLLKKPLPPEAVKPHPTKTFLSSIKAIYVVERLNDVFGIGSWSLRSEIVDNKTAMIVVKSTLTISDYGIELESFGGNDNGGENSKNHDTGDAYKGAVTDALTKICSYLEIGMDVFKGKADKAAAHQTTQSHSNGDDKPWLNEGTDQYKAAITKLKSGATTIDKIKLVMKVSKATETKLLEAVKS